MAAKAILKVGPKDGYEGGAIRLYQSPEGEIFLTLKETSAKSAEGLCLSAEEALMLVEKLLGIVKDGLQENHPTKKPEASPAEVSESGGAGGEEKGS